MRQAEATKTMKEKILAKLRWAVVSIVLLPGLALSDAIDGKSSLLCAPEEAYDCDEAENCMGVEEESIGMADFLEIDIKNKVIRAEGVDENDYSESAISTIEMVESGLLLHGSENELGWTLSISTETGRMVLAVAGLDHGFVVFGICSQR